MFWICAHCVRDSESVCVTVRPYLEFIAFGLKYIYRNNSQDFQIRLQVAFTVRS